MTNLPLDDSGRYSQTVILDGKVFEPKYLPCATSECLRTGSNLDMSDPKTQAYVKSLDQQVFKDMGKGATLGSLVTPVGVGGVAFAVVGAGAAAGESLISKDPVSTGLDKGLESGAEKGAEKFFKDVLGHTPGVAARAAALINLSGGWEAFRERVKIDLLGITPNEQKK